MKKYDVIAIGTGVGLAFIHNALQKGLNCAIIEKGKFGGTCLTRGCIPSKILVQPADLIRQSKRAAKIGVNIPEISYNFDLIAKRMWHKINLSIGMEEEFKNRDNLDVYKGVGEFIDNHTLRVLKEDSTYSENIYGDLVVIACGARSYVPNISGLKETGYLTYETFYGDKFPKKPWKNLVIIGGGVIGVEFAHIFSSLGTKVTIIEMKNRLLINEDHEVSDFLLTQFNTNNIDVYLNCVAIEASKSKGKIIKFKNHKTGIINEIECDEILMASGIKPNLDLLKLENTGVELCKYGWIKTNEFLETAVKSIIAIGDVNGRFQFRHKANYENFVAFDYRFNKDKPTRPANYDNVPWAVYTYPQIAHLGLTEKQALDIHEKVLIGKLKYSDVAKGYALGYEEGDSDNGFVKLILSPEMRILGAHIVGPYAAMLMQPYVYLKSTGMICKIDAFKDNINYETIKENEYLFNPVNEAMVIHPSLNELTGWAYRTLKWVTREN